MNHATAKSELLEFLQAHPGEWYHSSKLSDIFHGRLEHNTMIKWLCAFHNEGAGVESRKIKGASSHEYRYNPSTVVMLTGGNQKLIDDCEDALKTYPADKCLEEQRTIREQINQLRRV